MSYVVAALAVVVAALALYALRLRGKAADTQRKLDAADRDKEKYREASEAQIEANADLRRRFNAQTQNWRQRVLELEGAISHCDDPAVRRLLVLGLLSKPEAGDSPHD